MNKQTLTQEIDFTNLLIKLLQRENYIKCSFSETEYNKDFSRDKNIGDLMQ